MLISRETRQGEGKESGMGKAAHDQLPCVENLTPVPVALQPNPETPTLLPIACTCPHCSLSLHLPSRHNLLASGHATPASNPSCFYCSTAATSCKLTTGMKASYIAWLQGASHIEPQPHAAAWLPYGTRIGPHLSAAAWGCNMDEPAVGPHLTTHQSCRVHA